MRSLIVAAIFVAASVSAFTDFNALAPEHRRSVHPTTGNVHYEHEVHHTFPQVDGKEDSFFKATYKAEHESHWHFVQLHEHIEGMEGVHCGAGKKNEVDRLHIQKPSASLLEQVHKQKATGYSHTVITASARHQCKGKGIFRRLVNAVENQDGSLDLTVKAITYSHVFKNLDMKIETNHVNHRWSEDVKPMRLPANGMSRNTHALEHGMSAQSWYGDIGSACSSAVDDASSVCSDAASDVGSAADSAGHDLTAAADGVMSDMTSFDVDHTYQFKGVNWNNDVSKSFSQYDTATESASMAGSFTFTPSVTIVLKIDDFHLSNFEVYFTGTATAGVTGNFDAKLSKTWTNRKLITTLYVDAITFAIGPVPVWLTPSFPIFAGFTANIDGSLSVKAVLSATGTMSLGYGYSPNTGHRLINTHSLKFTHDFGPMDYSVDIGVQAYIEPVLAVTVESIANTQVGITLQADATIQSNNDCLFDLDINAQPTVALNAGIDASIMDHQIYKKDFGPWTLYSTKIPLYSYCKPQSAGAKSLMGAHDGTNSWSKRQMAIQSNEGVEVHPKKVVTTIEKSLDQHHIGKTWNGNSASLQNGHMISMFYGAQFSIGKQVNSSRLYVTLVKEMEAPGASSGMNGKISAVASMVYEAPGFPTVGKTQNYTYVGEHKANYNASCNNTHLKIVPSKWLTIKVDSENVRFVEMFSDMTYGSASLIAPPSNNDDSSFKIYKNGGATIAVGDLDVSGADVLHILIYAACATLVMILCIVCACVYFRKFKTARRRAEIYEAKENVANLVNGDDEPRNV